MDNNKKKRQLEFGGIVSLSVPEFDLELSGGTAGRGRERPRKE